MNELRETISDRDIEKAGLEEKISMSKKMAEQKEKELLSQIES